MAASVAGREIIYFTFGDQRLRDDLFNIYSLLREKSVSIGKLYQLLRRYGEQFIGSCFPNLDLYGYLFATLDALESENENCFESKIPQYGFDSEPSNQN